MKKLKFVAICFLVILVISCKKSDNLVKDKVTIAGNWKLLSDSSFSSSFNTTTTYAYKISPSDYYNFTAHNIIYIYERSSAGADIITYNSSLSKFALDSIVIVSALNGRQPYGEGTIVVKKLTANSLKIIYGFAASPETTGYDILDFSR